MSQEVKLLASENDFQGMKERAMQGSFVGFPEDWYDTSWNLPISMHGQGIPMNAGVGIEIIRDQHLFMGIL